MIPGVLLVALLEMAAAAAAFLREALASLMRIFFSWTTAFCCSFCSRSAANNGVILGSSEGTVDATGGYCKENKIK